MGAARGQLAAWSANSGELPLWLRWGKTANTLLPRLNRLDGTVEVMEGNTARLQADGATRFRGGVLARQRRCLVGNGGRQSSRRCVLWEERKSEMGRASASDRRAGCSRRGCDARRRTARGQREQESGDEWRTRGVEPLSRSATATDRFLKTNAIQCLSGMTDSTYSTIINS